MQASEVCYPLVFLGEPTTITVTGLGTPEVAITHDYFYLNHDKTGKDGNSHYWLHNTVQSRRIEFNTSLIVGLQHSRGERCHRLTSGAFIKLLGPKIYSGRQAEGEASLHIMSYKLTPPTVHFPFNRSFSTKNKSDFYHFSA